MTRGLNRVAVWGVVDGLVDDVFRETEALSLNEPLRGLVREAALSLFRETLSGGTRSRLAALAYLLHVARGASLLGAEPVDRVVARIVETSRTLARLEEQNPEVHMNDF